MSDIKFLLDMINIRLELAEDSVNLKIDQYKLSNLQIREKIKNQLTRTLSNITDGHVNCHKLFRQQYGQSVKTYKHACNY